MVGDVVEVLASRFALDVSQEDLLLPRQLSFVCTFSATSEDEVVGTFGHFPKVFVRERVGCRKWTEVSYDESVKVRGGCAGSDNGDVDCDGIDEVSSVEC